MVLVRVLRTPFPGAGVPLGMGHAGPWNVPNEPVSVPLWVQVLSVDDEPGCSNII